MARPARGRSDRARTDAGAPRRRTARPARPVEEGLVPVLARIAHEVDTAVRRPPTRQTVRTKFQVVALLVREERARVRTDETLTPNRRTQELKRLDGVATLLAKIAARDTSLLALLADDARVSDSALSYKEVVMRAGGLEPPARPEPVAFLLAHLEDLSYAEIAERLGVSASSVKQYLMRANRHCLFALGA